MKRIFLLAIPLLFTGFIASAQRYACVDTEYMLSSIPEYEQATKKIEDYAMEWQKELETKFQAIDQMYKSYQTESVLLPEDIKVKKENEIISAEKEAKDLQKKRFGSDGDLDKKRQELIKPIQDKIFNEVEKYAQEKNYAFVFDKASGASILYVDSKYDISNEILTRLGYKTKN